MVFILLATSRSRGLLILILASLQGAIVTDSITKCIYFDCKLNKESDGGIYILSIDYFGRYKSFCIGISPVYVPFPVYDYPNIFRFTKLDGIKR